MSNVDVNALTTPRPAPRAGPVDRRSRLLLQVARRILGANTLHNVVEAALSAFASLVPAWRHSVGLIDPSANTYTIYASHGEGSDHWMSGESRPLADFGGNLDLLRRGEIDLNQDLRATDSGTQAAGGMVGTAIQSQMLTPIFDRGVLLGTLNCASDTAFVFTTEHVDVAEEIADLIRQALVQLRFQRELEEAHAAALQASKAKSAFLANTSHELRTPLNAIIGYSELVDEELAELGAHEIREDVAKILKAGTHLLGLINEVLDLAKIEAGKLDFHLDEVGLNDLLDEVSGAVQPLVERGGNRWVLERDRLIGGLRTDRVRVIQILYNLIGNAAKFCRDGQIGLAVSHDHQHIEFAITDTGIGIRAEKLPTLFDAFTQAHATQGEDFGGTGLGLAICKRYAERLGGDILVESVVGEGTTFRVRLPRY